jgi:hypothetical protein
MLPVYEAIQLKEVIPAEAGHTCPWVVIVNTPMGIKPYVAKLYLTDQIESRNSFTAEILGNHLAKEFDLEAPDVALINFSEDFKMKLKPDEHTQLERADERLKFGTLYIDGYKRFEPLLPKSKISRLVSIDTLYAFDNFIRNGDRGDHKPNILLTNKNAYLIDHEMAFDIDNDTVLNFENRVWEDRFARHHIFQSYLKKARKKDFYFETFQEYLRVLNLNVLNPLFKEIERHDYETNRVQILEYLSHMKGNSGKFVTLLKGFTQ